MRSFLVVLSFAFLGAPAPSQTWRTALTVGADVGIWLDFAQTAHTLFAHDGRELNSIVGHHPTPVELTAWVVGGMAANTFVARKFRPWVNAATILVEVVSIRHNAAIIGFRLTP